MIHNLTSGGGGSGGTLTVTAPAGVTITVTNGKKTKVKTADAQGQATFKGLDTGTWTVTISAGSDTATATVEIVADYAKTMTFFAATIAVTWPEGSTCTCSDGSTILTAPDTSGSYTFTVPNAGTWTVSCTDGEDTDSTTVTITTDGESQSVELKYGMLYYNGNEYTSKTGGWIFHHEDAKCGTITKNEDSITYDLHGYSGANGYVTLCTALPVDLTNKTRLSINEGWANITNTNGAQVYFAPHTTQPGRQWPPTTAPAYISGTSGATSIDITEVTGSYYIVVQAVFSGGSSYKASGTITEVTVE